MGLQESLSDREYEILKLLAAGYTNREIAVRLFIAYKTVKWYNTQLYGKLGVSNREDAIRQAQLIGLLDMANERPVTETRHNLPHQTTPFIGRQQERSSLAQLMADPDTRLVTILAPGGMGKTRLALEAAHAQLGNFADGVFFVPLAPLSSPDDIVTTIAENVGFSFYGTEPPRQQLLNYFRERHTLLVLDNFEHLLDGAALVTDIMQAAPQVKVLATSREKLNLSGETVFTLSGLHFPDWEIPEDALEYDAVKLFIQSAHRARPNFELHSDDLDYLARICRLTAGMPLGIVLAAGWVDVLPLEQIATEIQQGIDILETELRDVPERQRSIRATFNYTWNRLAEVEQAIFRKLSIFRGGFTLPAAQAVAGADARQLRGLAQKALIQIERDERFSIHELLRQFGADKLAETDELQVMQARHAAFFADFMLERKSDIKTDRQLEALALIDPDFENVRVAWLYVVNQHDWARFPAFLDSVWFYCRMRARGEGGVLLEQAVRTLQSTTPSLEIELALGRVLARLGWAYNDVGFFAEGATSCDEAFRILRQHDSPEDLVVALHHRLYSAVSLNQSEVGVQVIQEGLGIARSIGDKFWEGNLLMFAGWASGAMGDLELACQCTIQGLAILQGLGVQSLWPAYLALGTIHMSRQNYEQAKHQFKQALVASRAFNHASSLAFDNAHLATIALVQHDYTAARTHLRQALQFLWDTGRIWLAPWPMVHVAQIYAEQQDADRSVEILATIHPHLLPMHHTDKMAAALRRDLESRLEPERFAAAWAHGQRRELGTLIVELLSELADT